MGQRPLKCEEESKFLEIRTTNRKSCRSRRGRSGDRCLLTSLNNLVSFFDTCSFADGAQYSTLARLKCLKNCYKLKDLWLAPTLSRIKGDLIYSWQELDRP